MFPTPIPSANNVIRHELDAEFVAFVHACFGFPAVSTFLAAAKRNYLASFPRITYAMIAANRPNAIATAQGHLDQTRHSLRSTAPSLPTTAAPTIPFAISDLLADFHDKNVSAHDQYDHHEVFTLLLPTAHLCSADLTGRFPVSSRRGHQYFLVSVWNGYIHFELLTSRASASLVKAYKATLQFFAERGRSISIARLDNETSAELDAFLRANVTTVQYIPPHSHRANCAERAIRTAKNHIVSMLSGAAPDFPLAEWDHIVEQAELTLNILRPYTPNPAISAYHGLYGHQFNFFNHPIAPFGTRVLIHEPPDKRTTWAPHGLPGFYLGPAISHHRSFRVYCSPTRAQRISDSLAWFPAPFRMPGSSLPELLLAQLSDLSSVITRFAASDVLSATSRQPFTVAATAAVDALTNLSRLFQPAPTSTPPPSPPSLLPPGEQRVPPSLPPPGE